MPGAPLAFLLLPPDDLRLTSVPLREQMLLGLQLPEWSRRNVLKAGCANVVTEPAPAIDLLEAALDEDRDNVLVIAGADQPLAPSRLFVQLLETCRQTGRPIRFAPAATPAALPASLALRALRILPPSAGSAGGLAVLLELVQEAEALSVSPEEQALLLKIEDALSLSRALSLLRADLLQRIFAAGVVIEDPASVSIDAGVVVGPRTLLRPGTILRGDTRIGVECEIGPNVEIIDCVIHDRVRIHSSVLTSCEVGEESRVGPFAQIRAGSVLGHKVKLGNFVEVKNASLADGVSAGHLTYLGDATIGTKTNIGAGTITCNYDGKKKHRTTIGRGAFVGSQTTLIAPVVLGDGAFTAAGTVVTENVPPEALAIGRTRQVVKEGWARRRRELLERQG